MCNVNPRNTELEQQILATGLNIISKAIEANLSVNQSYSATDVLTTATNAYKEGKITKAQYFAVINALDENPEAPYRVLENLNLKEKYDKMQQDYDILAEKFCNLTEQMESAYKQWELVSNFMKTQGLKTDAAEFPKEALNTLSKSLPTTSSSYPKWVEKSC